MRRFSSRASSPPAEEASKVVMLDGTLREFFRGVTADEAIEDEPDCIIFDTDKLYVGEYILPLKPDAELDPGHIYMLMPQSMSHHRVNSVDMEKLAMKTKEALLMAAVERKFERSSSFCGLREMLSGKEIGERANWREEKREKREGNEGMIISRTGSRGKTNKVETGGEGNIMKRVASSKGKENKMEIDFEEGKKKWQGKRKQSKCRYVWYLGFASLPIEDDILDS